MPACEQSLLDGQITLGETQIGGALRKGSGVLPGIVESGIIQRLRTEQPAE
ncbi:hypothetical protein D3C84_1199140 [compost metagenome]